MKKLLSVLLALVMLVSVISVPAFAEGEELSVVYVANGKTLAERTAEDGVKLGNTFAVNFRAPNTSEEYFTGWYLDEDCTGDPVASINVEVDGANYLYAGYEKYATVMTPQYYSGTGINMYFPFKDAAGAYHAQFPVANLNYATMETVEEEGVGTYWKRSHAGGKASSQPFALIDENNYAFQYRAGSTYKISMRIKSLGGNGVIVEVGGRTSSSLNAANTGWNGEGNARNLANPVTIANEGQTRLATDWTEFTNYLDTTNMPDGAYEFLAIRFNNVASGDEIYIKDFIIEEVSVEYYVEDELIEARYGIEKGAAVELINLEDYYDIPEGKEFSGWYLDKECTQAATALTATGAVKLYAKVGERPKAKYIAGSQIVKEEALTMGGTYTPENYMLEDEYIPDGYYFTGWYTDEACTQPVKIADLTKEITVTGDFKRYAGLKEYETTFEPVIFNSGSVPSSIEKAAGFVYALQYPIAHSSGAFINYIASDGQSQERSMTTVGDDTIYTHLLGAKYGEWIFHDENGKVFKAKPGASYKITFEYKFTSPGSGLQVAPYIGVTKTQIKSSTSTLAVQGYRFNDGNRVIGPSAGSTLDITKTDWEPYETTLTTPDIANYHPIFFVGQNNKGGTVEFRNVKVEMQVANVNLHIGDNVTKVDATPGVPFIPEIEVEEPNGSYFTGWYTDVDCTEKMPEGGITGAVGETKDLYAGFETYKTVKYFVNGEEIQSVGNLKVGDVHAVEADFEIPADKIFMGWFTEDTFDNEVASVTISGDVNLYAKIISKPKAQYIANGKVVKEESLEIGQTYTPENYMLENEHIPAGYYFTGWYTDEACTIPVQVADLTKEITVDGDFVRYAGLKPYQTEFSPVVFAKPFPQGIEGVTGTLYALQYPINHSDGVFLNYITSNGINHSPVMTTEGTDTIFSLSNGGNYGAWIFHDENGKVFKAKPGASYKITYEYRFLDGTNAALEMQPNIGFPVARIVSSTTSIKIQGYRIEGYQRLQSYGEAKGIYMDVNATTWTPYETTLTTLDDAAYYPIFYMGYNNKAANVEFKNVKVEEVVTKAYLHIGGEVKEEIITLGGKFKPENPLTAPEDEEFKGWYLDENFETAMDAEGVDVSGDIHLYAKFGAPLSVVYNYKNGKETITEEIIVGGTYAIDRIAPNTQDEYFVGWYDNAEFTGTPITSLSNLVDGANNIYARYKEFKKVYTVNFPSSALNTNVPKAYMPYIGTEGTLLSQIRLNNYWDGFVLINDAAEGDYYKIKSDGNTQLIFADEDGFAYQIRQNTSYIISFEYKVDEGNSVAIVAGAGKAKTKADGTALLKDTGSWDSSSNSFTKISGTVTAESTEWQSETFTINSDSLDHSANYPLIGVRFSSFAGKSSSEYAYIKNIVVKEVGAGDSGEYNEDIGGVVYEAGAVLDGETYAVTFDYAGAAANLGFFTADKDGATYASVSKVEGEKTVLAVNGDGTYTAFVTVDMLSAQGETLYMYAQDVQTAGEVSNVTVTKLENAITNEGLATLAVSTSSQAIRFYFGYDTTDGKNIILGGKSYEVKKRGFLFANGEGDKKDDGVYVGAAGTVNKFVEGDKLANCWQATQKGENYNIWFSSYVGGFANDDTRKLFVKGYITFTDGTNEFTIYAKASNGSVAQIQALQ